MNAHAWLSMTAEILHESDLASLHDSLEKAGKRIVALSGSFDVFHAGHVSFLEEAKSQGDVLCVFLNSDASVKLYKGIDRPYVPLTDRVRILAAQRSVDYIVVFDDATPLRLVALLRPHVYVNGSERGECVERTVLDTYGGKLHVVEKDERSSSALIKKIQEQRATTSKPAVFISSEVLRGESDDGEKTACKRVVSAGYQLCLLVGDTDETRAFPGALTISRAHSESEKSGPYEPSLRLFDIAREQGITLDKSWIVTTKQSDVWDARLSNTGVILIGTRSIEASNPTRGVPHHYAESLSEALTIITTRTE